ncbi:hypothetical protein B0H12DRAFT_823555 [Mycena haematopus]|nr:hypothetical protein B0H12DRAFT_823555 [Mycena haematopus]
MSDMISSPPAKRKRTENEDITRSNIWYDDGSVVLQAGNTQFRVHWAILAKHSPFFHQMRGLPQPPNQPSVDGCPLVELPDASIDVEFLLEALYSPTFLAKTALPLSAVAALIRLGRKYDFKELLESAMWRLTFEFPATLEEYDRMRPYKPTRLLGQSGLTFDIISLARENDILSVLPCAYYRAVSIFPLNDLLAGIPRPDGTLASLAPVDLHQCLLGREKLKHVQFQKEYAYGWFRFWSPGEDCSGGSEQCAKVRDALLWDHWDTPKVHALWSISSDASKKLCSSCRKSVKELNTAGKKRTWDELPVFFGLRPWNELKNDP